MESDNRGIAVCLTLILAVVLSVMPLSGDWIVWKPNFLLLTVMAWIMRWPNGLGIFFAASIGLLADLLTYESRSFYDCLCSLRWRPLIGQSLGEIPFDASAHHVDGTHNFPGRIPRGECFSSLRSPFGDRAPADENSHIHAGVAIY